MNNILLIGAAGQQGSEYFSLLSNNPNLRIGVLDSNIAQLDKLYSADKFYSLDEAIANFDFQTAVVCVPHSEHFKITAELLKHNKNIIKEKPLAISTNDIHIFEQIANTTPRIFTIVQRNFNSAFYKAQELIKNLGKIYAYKYEYSLKIPVETTGWRANFDISHGGVLIDMGYHILDIALRFFGPATNIQAKIASLYNPILEDSISILLDHGNTKGTVIINRHSSLKRETFEIYGEHGTLIITPKGFSYLDRTGNTVTEYTNTESTPDIKFAMFQKYLESFGNDLYLYKHINHHKAIVSLIENIYKLCRPTSLHQTTEAEAIR